MIRVLELKKQLSEFTEVTKTDVPELYEGLMYIDEVSIEADVQTAKTKYQISSMIVHFIRFVNLISYF